MIRYRLHQITKTDGMWVSEVLEAPDRRHVCQDITAGFIFGEPRWATYADTGEFISGVDGAGRPITEVRVACNNSISWG